MRTWRQIGGWGHRFTTLHRRWPWPRVRYTAVWLIATTVCVAVVLVVVVGVALSLGGCSGPTFRVPSGASRILPGGDADTGVLGLIIAQLIWLIIPLAIATVAVWVLAVWQPWISIKAAIGATMGLGGLIVLIWIMSILAAYTLFVVAAVLAGLVVWNWPWIRMQWRKRGDYAAGIDDIKHGRLSHGLGNLSLAGVRTTNGKGEVRIGRGLRRKRVRIGATQQRGDI